MCLEVSPDRRSAVVSTAARARALVTSLLPKMPAHKTQLELIEFGLKAKKVDFSKATGRRCTLSSTDRTDVNLLMCVATQTGHLQGGRANLRHPVTR